MIYVLDRLKILAKNPVFKLIFGSQVQVAPYFLGKLKDICTFLVLKYISEFQINIV